MQIRYASRNIGTYKDRFGGIGGILKRWKEEKLSTKLWGVALSAFAVSSV